MKLNEIEMKEFLKFTLAIVGFLGSAQVDVGEYELIELSAE